MITGAHIIIYSKDPEADRAFFRDVLEFDNVDVGGGWLIFRLPPSELGVHGHDKNNIHEFNLMCADIDAFIDQLRKKDISCSEKEDEEWGIRCMVMLPGGGKLPVYQPKHIQP